MIQPTYTNAVDTKTLHTLLKKYARGAVLDVGCGDGSLKNWLPNGTTYHGIDQEAQPGVDQVGDIHHLPFKNEEFETVLCTSVLEHVQNDAQVVSELYRVLKKDGTCIVTIPFMLHYHQDPEDYRRLTHAGLKELLKNNGFRDIQLFRNNGVYAMVEFTFFSVLVHARREHLWFKHWYSPLYYAFILGFFAFFKAATYLIGPLQKIDTSVYVGVAAVATK